MSLFTGFRSDHRRSRRRSWRLRATLLTALVTITPLAPAQEDYDTGKRAYLAGDYAEAVRIWQPLADAGNKFAQFSLGSLYFEGAGVEKSMENSARWFRAAAEQGYAPAQFNLGNAYKNGNGVEQNDLEAAEWWRKAAEQDFAPAQFNLATQYYFGRGVPKDEEIAIRWYRRAAENGHAQAQRLFSMTDSPAAQARASAPAPAVAGATAAAAAPEPEPAPEPVAAAPAPAAPAPAPEPVTTATASAGAPALEAANQDWILAQKPGDYTLQLLATHSEDLLRAYLDKHRFNGPVAYFAFQREGKRWYAAVYGAYAEKSQAQNAVATLPPEVGKNTPWIRQFGGIQKLIGTP